GLAAVATPGQSLPFALAPAAGGGPSLPGAKYTLVSAVSPAVPTHWTVMVVVGSRCQVRNNVSGWKVGPSTALSVSTIFPAGASAPSSRPAARPATDDARNARR